MREEFKENEDLPNTTNPDDWAKIAGKKGERIVYVRPLMGETNDKHRTVEQVVTTGLDPLQRMEKASPVSRTPPLIEQLAHLARRGRARLDAAQDVVAFPVPLRQQR